MNDDLTPAGEGRGAAIPLGEAVHLLDSMGFVDHANLPAVGPMAYLVVGLRPTPTLVHFDPEVVSYWSTHDGRGVRREFVGAPPLHPTTEFSWGKIEIVDRHQIRNTYLEFGGLLRLDQVGDLLVCRFESPAPILRRGGHSQLFDLGAANAGEFFARLMIRIDYVPGFESLLSAATPVARFSAFVADFLARCQGSANMRQTHGPLIRELQLERQRIQASEPAEWTSGIDLLAAANVS